MSMYTRTHYTVRAPYSTVKSDELGFYAEIQIIIRIHPHITNISHNSGSFIQCFLELPVREGTLLIPKDNYLREYTVEVGVK